MCENWVQEADSWLRNRVEKYQARSLFLPAGETPKQLYAKWRQAYPDYLQKLRLLQVDDLIEGPGSGMFARFFREELPGLSVQPPLIEERADLAILGIGTNGHVAFHEPGIPMEFAYGEVKILADTAQRLGLESGTRALTYGVKAFSEAKAILLVIKGENKRKAMDAFLREDPSLPASGLFRHSDITVLSDLPLAVGTTKKNYPEACL